MSLDFHTTFCHLSKGEDMKTNNLLATVAVSTSILLSGCATTSMQDVVGQINGSLNELGSALSGAGSNSTEQNRTNLKDTKLMGVFSSSLSTDGTAPEWPKVAITNLQVPSDLASLNSLRLKYGQCIIFNAVLWHDSKNNEKFNDVSLCSQDLPKRSNGFVTTWRTFPSAEKQVVK
jgi:outer membrane murein-binding lipoprotein Lpp